MRLKLLGTAAGGGFPQWNCNCSNCQGVRTGRRRATPRLQSSLAVAATDGDWILVNASPDVRAQLELHLPLTESAPPRSARVSTVILTDAQLDHATGLLLIREAPTPLRIYCTDSVYEDLTTAFPALRMLTSYRPVERLPLPTGDHVELPELPGILVRAIPLAGKAPPYSPRRGGGERPDESVALAFTDKGSGKSALYAPSLGAIDEQVLPYVKTADLLLIDGTTWADDDLSRQGCGAKTGRSMGHLPLSGADGLLEQLARHMDRPTQRRILVHVNNTNPVLDEESVERRALADSCVELGYDGQELLL